MLPKWKLALIALLAAAGIGIAVWYSVDRYREDKTVTARLETITKDYRQILILMDGADALDESMRARCRAVGRRIFWEKQQMAAELARDIAGQPRKIDQAISYVTSKITLPGTARLRDADRLAFLELFEELSDAPSAPADLRTALDDLHSIQNTYREEVSRIFSQFATRGAFGKREKWDSYMSWLRTLDSRDRILAGYDDGSLTDTDSTGMRGRAYPNEISGIDFPAKTVALTFDDGPHPKYTGEIEALLRKYGIRAGFFELGQNLGAVGASGITLSRNAAITKRLLEEGHTIA
ncbi:MAG TPA: polysaccharide deacetylase family protein, partial [Bryobacteraceae bacterium]|nr:polysaccharide deacetylase family protein [Bryobacteraceae bacterium]